MKVTIRVFLLFCIITSVGCSHVAPRYGLSADNIENLKALKAGTKKRIAVGTYTSYEPGKQSILCRAAGPVEAPDGKTFDAYLRDALISELKIAELFDERAPTVLQGHLEHIDFNSNIGAGNWTIRVKFTAPGAEPFTVQHTYPFSTNFVADIACGQVAQSLMPATQDFHRTVFSNPAFRRLLLDK